MKKILIYLFLISFLACNTLGGKSGISDSIEQSKEIGTYLKEFRIISQEVELDSVKNIWAEYSWNYPFTFKERKIRKESQTLIFNFSSSNVLGQYGKTWALREITLENENYNCGFSLPYRQVFCEVGNYLKDTLRLNLVRGDLFKNKIESKQEIILVAKKR